jgi:hypothetical protein
MEDRPHVTGFPSRLVDVVYVTWIFSRPVHTVLSVDYWLLLWSGIVQSVPCTATIFWPIVCPHLSSNRSRFMQQNSLLWCRLISTVKFESSYMRLNISAQRNSTDDEDYIHLWHAAVSSGYFKEEYWEEFMALRVKNVSGQLNTMMNYTFCIKI